MPRRRELAAALTSGPFAPPKREPAEWAPTSRAAAASIAPHHGVRVQAEQELALEQGCLALASLVPDGAFSHATAGRLLELPLPTPSWLWAWPRQQLWDRR